MAELSDQFVHLHLHSQYSLLDGGNRLDRLVERVKELGMSAVAVTDHGNLFGAADFYLRARAAGIKPILGIEAYVATDLNGQPSDRTNREFTGVADGGFHLVLLAENQTGWNHLLKLSSDSFINGFYYRPRMDKTTLAQWSDGLIAINGHLGSSIAHHLLRYVQSNDEANYRAAMAEAQWHADTFGVNEEGQPRFFIELQRHGVPEQEAINPHLIQLARDLHLPLVADNDAHFLLEEDYDTHDTLVCISLGKTKDTEHRLRYPPQLYVKSPQQMAALFEDLPEAIQNSAQIAQRCNAHIDFKANHAPVVRIEKAPPQAATQGPADGGAPVCEPSQTPGFPPASQDAPVGSTAWYNAFCARYRLVPFDQTRDQGLSADELKCQCDAALRDLAEAGLVWRYGQAGITDEHRARLDRELTILADKNISAYFLIVWDFVNEARRRGIPANARGSGVGTMVGYCLGLSNACPVKYGLLFERFTDPDRSEYPDIDIDMCQDGRGQILDYVRDKYGHVAQIITFNVLKARAAVRDVGRVLNVPLPEVDKVCKLIGDGLNMTIDRALEKEPDLKALVDQSPIHRQMIDTARKLEGMARHAGVHAAGVVIATQPLENIVPLALNKQGDKDIVVTQWDGPTCEKVGLLKMDFLGLRTLSIIEKARQIIRQTLSEQAIRAAVASQASGSGVREPGSAESAEQSVCPEPDPLDALDLDRLTYDDQRVLDLFRRGETAGVFQFESGGMRNLLMGMKPDRLEDLIAANALFRPGPMELIPDYNDRKHGRTAVPRVHPIVEKYTDETYGIMVYQEQVMQIVHELGDIPLRQAYTLIKAISKKKRDVIDANRARFIEGAGDKGMPQQQAADLFDLILKFAGYGFNKSHSTGYAIVAYQTAYLKTYFPVQYMAAVLTYESVSTDKVVEYIDECKRALFPDGHRGIDVKPPDINLSEVGFTVVYDPGEQRDNNHGHIRFGLSAVKGVGEKAIRAIMEAGEKQGPFTSLYGFCERVPLNLVNRATIEALVKCGAFDSLHGAPQRAAMCEALDGAIQAGQRAANDRLTGQMNFFESLTAPTGNGSAAKVEPAVHLPTTAAWSTSEQLKHEKSVLGFYVSSHPLNEHCDTLQRFASTAIDQIDQLAADVDVVVGGMLTRVRPTLVRNGRSAGQKMAMITIEDPTGSIDGVVFSDAYALAGPLLEPERIVFLRGRVDRRRESPNIVVEDVIPVEQAAEHLTQAVKIVLDQNDEPAARRNDGGRNGHRTNGHGNGNGAVNGELVRLKTLLRQASGNGGQRGAFVYFEVRQAGRIVTLRVNGLRVAVDRDLADRIATVLRRNDCCQLLGPQKLLSRGDKALRHDERATPQPRLRTTADDGAVCASIDRY